MHYLANISGHNSFERYFRLINFQVISKQLLINSKYPPYPPWIRAPLLEDLRVSINVRHTDKVDKVKSREITMSGEFFKEHKLFFVTFYIFSRIK